MCAPLDRLSPPTLALSHVKMDRAAALRYPVRTVSETNMGMSVSVDLAVVWATSPDAMALSDADGIVLDANPAYYDLYGLIPEQVIGHSFAIILPEAERASAVERYQAVFRVEGPLPPFGTRIVLVDGTERIVESRIGFVEHDGQRTLMLSIIRDVTDQARAERERDRALLEAEAALRAREDFLAGVSHDLRGPLTVILARAQMLQLMPKHPEASLEQIASAAVRMRAMLDDLLDAARLGAGHALALHRRPTDLGALARRAANEQRRQIEGITILVEDATEPLVGEWDAGRIERAIGNLLGNAIKYSEDDGEVALHLSRETDPAGCWAVLQVRDRGIGIVAADLPHVFDRFFRGSNAAAAGDGAGIGLAGAKQLVEAHGGTLTAASEGEGRGSTFTMRLPLSGSAGQDIGGEV